MTVKEKKSYPLLFANILGEHFPLEGTLNFKIIWGKQYAKLGPIRSSDRKVTILEDAAFRTSSQDARILQRIPPRIKCFYTATDNQRYQLGEVKVALSDQNISMQQVKVFIIDFIPSYYNIRDGSVCSC